jgi:heme/copper-type cytochrome/quinol oxidase subunit 1
LRIKEKPYHLLLVLILLLVITPLLFLNADNVVDIHLHDTYFVVAHTHIFWLIGIIVFFIWILYLLTNKVFIQKKLLGFI